MKLEYFEEAGGALCRLLWSSAHLAKDVVPQRQLYPEEVLVTQNPDNLPVRIFPNPVSEILTIEMEKTDDYFSKVEIHNALGQLLWQQQEVPDERIHVDVHDLPDGMYWLRCERINGAFIVIGFMKIS